MTTGRYAPRATLEMVESFDDSRQTLTVEVKVVDVPEIPERWSLLVGDALHNLRCALDYLAYELVALNNNGIYDESTQFPIATDPAADERAYGRHGWRTLQLLGPQRPLIEQAQPYHDPANIYAAALGVLQGLSNSDKHRLLVPAAVAADFASMALVTHGAGVPIRLGRPSRAGRYAQQRYERGIGSYRARMRLPLLIVLVPMGVFVVAVMATRKLETWSVAEGAVIAAGIAIAMSVRDEAPSHILNWKRGAAGERKTEKALQPLERKGWTVEHDIQRNRENLDHVVKGPAGVFLLETKNLAGTMTVERGVLVRRQWDDPADVYRLNDLCAAMDRRAKELSARLRAETGRRVWVHQVVVVWGDFPAGRVEHGNVVYVHGDRLVEWLKSLCVPGVSPG